MADLTKEDYEALPEAAKEDYTQVGDVYKHAGVLKLKSSLNDLDEKYKLSQQGFQDLEARVSSFESEKEEAIRQARDEAIEEAKKSGDSEEAKRLMQEREEDLAKRAREEGKLEALKEFKTEQLTKDADSTARIIANDKGRTDAAKKALYLLLKNMIKVTEDKITFFDDEGRALSLDNEKDYVSEFVMKSDTFKHLLKPDVNVQGGGLASGGDGRTLSKALKDMTEKERLDFKQRDPEGFKQALNS